MITPMLAANASNLHFDQQLILAALALLGGGMAGAVVSSISERRRERRSESRDKRAQYKLARGAARRLRGRMEGLRETFQAIDDAWPSLADLTLDVGDTDEALLSAELEIDDWQRVVEARESVTNVQIRSRNHAPDTDVSRKLISKAVSRLGEAEASLLAFDTAGFVE